MALTGRGLSSNVRVLVLPEALIIEPLAFHREALPELCRMFEAEWPSWYGAGGRGSAADDLRAFAATSGLPFGVVALRRSEVCGFAALKGESIPSRRHLKVSLRRQGVGAALLAALEEHARDRGCQAIHCATSTSESLLQRRGYRLLERVMHDGQELGVYRRGL